MKNEKGRLLATGHGVNSMMDVSYKKHLTNDNSILVVKDPSDFDSKWEIYSRKK